MRLSKRRPKKPKIIEETTGYYTLPCSRDPFDGKVVKLSGDEFYLFFQLYSETSEYDFREKLERIDEWFLDKPYKVQSKYVEYLPKWLKKS